MSNKRFQTREVMVGNVGVGGDNPIRIQSMTTTNTRDIEATIDQVIKLADQGCEIARVTVQGMKEAEACEGIKNGLIQRGYTIPLVADIHFYPPAAIRVIDFVDKVRVNPGNFVDKRASFKVLEYDDKTYAQEIEKIEAKFVPLVQKCKLLKRAMRIGTNHGSLSDRIMNRYGDSPIGMVESAIEFAQVCRKYDYHDFIFSMKASNPQVMIAAYRLLVSRMMEMGWDYPLHLGVTEAGAGEDGRIKSAMGIGSLLLDGLGDTIRVSLTEDPWHEIDPCKRLVDFAQAYRGVGCVPFKEPVIRRSLTLPKHLSMHRDGTVILSVEGEINYEMIGCDTVLGKPKLSATSVDNLVLKKSVNQQFKSGLKDVGVGILKPVSLLEAQRQNFAHKRVDALYVEDENGWESIKSIHPSMIILRPKENRIAFCRKFFAWVKENDLDIPVIINFRYTCSKEDIVIQAAAEYGSIFCDGMGEGIWLEAPYDISFLRQLSFNILQAARMRIIKTDFISCPSCGRTLFNLQDVTKRIQAKTAHLPGVKIAIMGCIVNGPGEMADADFGYVGSRPGKIDLYVGRERVCKNIDFADADSRLVDLIKAHNRWVEPADSTK